MTQQIPRFFVYTLLLSMFLQTCQIHCLKGLVRRKLSAESLNNQNSDDVRSLIQSSMTSGNAEEIDTNKIDTLNDETEAESLVDSTADDNVASESKDASIYEDEVDEDDGDQQLQIEDLEYKRSDESEPTITSTNQSDKLDFKEINGVTKRETKIEEEYDETDSDVNPNSSDFIERKRFVVPESSIPENEDNLKKKEHIRDTNSEMSSDLDYEKQIEDQIEQRINSIKEDIKREIERKQLVREIEANNAKYDELELRPEDNEVVDEAPSDMSKLNSRGVDATLNNEAAGENSSNRSKRSDLDVHREVDKIKEKRDEPLVVPVKKRSFERQVILVDKRELRNRLKKKSTGSPLIPETNDVKVEDDLRNDLTLDPNRQLTKSQAEKANALGNQRSAMRSVVKHEESPSTRHRRDMSVGVGNLRRSNTRDINEAPNESSNFLFTAREKPECRKRRRRRMHHHMRSNGHKKGRKRPHHSRRHRAIRNSSANDEEFEDERDKRAMSFDEEAALEYKESFGGFQSESGSDFGRFKRIKRSAEV